MMILFFRYKNVFSFWKWDYIMQFTDEHNQNKVEHTLEGGKKGKHQHWRQCAQKQENKLHSSSATDTQEPKWNWPKWDLWKINPWNKNGTYVMKNKF